MRKLLVACLMWVVPAAAAASECDNPAPDWLACEDFEGGGQGWQAWFAGSPFTECNGCLTGGDNDPERIQLLEDASQAHDGSWSLYLPATAAAGYRGASLTWRNCDGQKRAGCNLLGEDQLHFRTWVRLAPDHQYVHHFLSVAGTQPSNYWDSDGNAGCRPNGYRAAGTTLDFDSGDGPHPLWFYTYTPDMRCDSGGYCSGSYAQSICDGCATKDMPCTTNGLECCWGNAYRPAPDIRLERGRWVCLELMMRLNTPGQSDGEMAFWMDGSLAHTQSGMYWRDVAELQLNKGWLQHYVASGDATQPNRVWFDDMIVSTSYIGCGTQPTTDGGTPNDAGITPDAGTADAGGTPDASTGSDGGTSNPDGGSGAGDGTGCGCTTTRGSALWVLLLIAFWFRARTT